MAVTMAFLVINCGTSSVKITLFDENLKKLQNLNVQGPFQGLENYPNLRAIGHRIVHGGEKYVQTTLITSDVEKDLWDLCEWAPLHNPPSLGAISYCKKHFPKVPQFAIFDTAFHSNKPQEASFYAIPWALSQKYKIKRYGFHGIAHAFSSEKYNKEKGRVITAHLGSGSSITAIKDGTAIDTSMGFTPLDGIMMAKRSGELDPSVVAFLCKKEKKNPDEIISILNHESGLIGVFGKQLDIKELCDSGEPQARFSVSMFVYQIQKKIGSFIPALKGLDALIFSGGIGENSSRIRSQIAEGFKWLGMILDEEKNENLNIVEDEIVSISHAHSSIQVYVVGCDENLFIAKEMKNNLFPSKIRH